VWSCIVVIGPPARVINYAIAERPADMVINSTVGNFLNHASGICISEQQAAGRWTNRRGPSERPARKRASECDAGLGERGKQRFVQQFIPQPAVEALDEGVLHGLAGAM
jgi:hypothetical protein